MKRLNNAVAALAVVVFSSASSFASDDKRPPVPFSGAWSYSSSGSNNRTSWSESLSVSENREAGFADITVEEMVNGVTHKKNKKHVPIKDANAVLDKLVAEAKKGL